MQLLEANKKRLLRQQDWIGVAPSKPVDLQFLSVREKNRIGKRRRIDAKSRVAARRLSPAAFPHRTGQDELEGHGNAFMSGALPILRAADNIRVRIGSHALTAASTQSKNDAASQTNSDSMLFDEEGEEVARRQGSEAPQSIAAYGHVLAATPRSMNNQPMESYEDHPPRHDHYTHHGLTAQLNSDAGGHIWTNTLDQSIQASEATEPGYQITHYVGGVERPLKLVFGKQSSYKASHVASPTDQTGEAQQAHASIDAEEVQSGRAFQSGRALQNIGATHRSSFRRPPIPSAIVDDEPWRTYLGIDQSSSDHVCVDDGTGTSVPQPHAPARNTGADRTSWPRHTTQGNLTHANLSIVSASLPAPNQPTGRIPDARPYLRSNMVKEIDEHEKLWRSFALGSDPESAIGTIHTHNDTSEDLMSRATKGYASTRLPLSTAVTSVSSSPFKSTPFRSLSGQASRISDDVQHAPYSGSRSITPAAPSYITWGRIDSHDEEDVQGEDESREMNAGSCFSERSAPASLQDCGSHDGDLYGDTRTSRSHLDRLDRAWDDVSRRAQASGSVVWRRGRVSSIRDVPDSDDVGIDLVDVHRLT
ncbi:uncharacterized protein EKO05_0007785 [Ascochyta rabiei]|nr:uncharacterized protein EKO05_0007785 [Ascochyta rabiei]UPX17431.1 hypothetical protein EKO05_0007785 [Ascochyta rabiei]